MNNLPEIKLEGLSIATATCHAGCASVILKSLMKEVIVDIGIEVMSMRVDLLAVVDTVRE